MKIEFYVDGKKIVTNSEENKSLLEVILENNIDIKANCEGNGVCGKCQVIFDKEHYDKLEISDEELDTLEKQMNLTSTSRLSCQVKICEELNGADIKISK